MFVFNRSSIYRFHITYTSLEPVRACCFPDVALQSYLAAYYRVAQKERNTYDQLFQENEGQNKQVVCIIAYKILFSSKMTPRSLVLMKAF